MAVGKTTKEVTEVATTPMEETAMGVVVVVEGVAAGGARTVEATAVVVVATEEEVVVAMTVSPEKAFTIIKILDCPHRGLLSWCPYENIPIA